MEIFAFSGDVLKLNQPCVTCGMYTGNWCDTGSPGLGVCKYRKWMTKEAYRRHGYVRGANTPLCTKCDAVFGRCRYCQGNIGCDGKPTRQGVTPSTFVTRSRASSVNVRSTTVTVKETQVGQEMVLAQTGPRRNEMPADLCPICKIWYNRGSWEEHRNSKGHRLKELKMASAVIEHVD